MHLLVFLSLIVDFLMLLLFGMFVRCLFVSYVWLYVTQCQITSPVIQLTFSLFSSNCSRALHPFPLHKILGDMGHGAPGWFWIHFIKTDLVKAKIKLDSHSPAGMGWYERANINFYSHSVYNLVKMELISMKCLQISQYEIGCWIQTVKSSIVMAKDFQIIKNSPKYFRKLVLSALMGLVGGKRLWSGGLGGKTGIPPVSPPQPFAPAEWLHKPGFFFAATIFLFGCLHFCDMAISRLFYWVR